MKRTLISLLAIGLFGSLETGATAKGIALGYQPAKLADSTMQKPVKSVRQTIPGRANVAVESTPKVQSQYSE